MGNKISTNSRKGRFSTSKSVLKWKKQCKQPSTTESPPTPVPSCSQTTSMTSSQSSMNDSIVRQGRKFHNISESIYWLPNDDEEMDRLIGQHFALKALFEGNIAKEALERVPLEDGAKILDVGCGPGTWLMDVATERPNCELYGVDMCNVFPSDIRPPNVHFMHGNVLERLPFEDDTFDFINMRFLMLALRQDEWLIALKEILRVLKPGGCFQSLESGMMDRGNDFCLWVGKTFIDVMRSRGQEPYIAFTLENIMKEAGFDFITSIQRDTYLDKPDPLNREFLWDIRNIVKSTQPFLAGPLGIPPDQYAKFLDKFEAECQKPPGAKWMIVINVAQKQV